MLPQKEQQIIAVMHIQIIHDGVHALQVSRELGIDPTEKVQEGGLGSPRVALRIASSCRFPQGSEDRALASATIIELLFGPLCWPFRRIDKLRSLVAFGRDGSHLINIKDGAVLWRL